MMFLCFFLLLTLITGCTASSTTPATSPTSAEHEHGGHHHAAPHGGALIGLGEEFAHVELLLEPETGRLTAYVLDGEAEAPVRLENATLSLKLDPGGAVTLQPVADELTGETAASTSQFSAQVDALKGLSEFKGALQTINVKGREFNQVEFSYPLGNESH